MNIKFPKIVAEVGCNHKGQMEIAHKMIMTASQFSKVHAVKFQKRCVKEFLSNEQYNAPHPVLSNSYGSPYGKHREKLEFDLDQHRQLKKWCEEYGIIYSSSVWDLTSAKEIVSLNTKFIKIPSACNLNKEMLEFLCENYAGEIHISLGMTTHDEEEKIISLFESYNRNNELIVYSCTSGYPVSYNDVCLLEICRLKKNYGRRVKAIGFSGHHLGIAIDVVAFHIGARWIERHFTLDRTWKGTDHAASLEPDDMRRLVRDCNVISKTITYKPQEILNIESKQRAKLKKDQIKWQ